MFTPSAKAILLAVVLACTSPFVALAAAQQLPQVQEQPARSEESSHGPHPLHEIDDAMISLPLAALLGAALALRPKRRGTPPRTPAVVQTQIMLAVVGAVIMLVVGASLARAFGIVGAANLIRYRSKIEDPKDAVVMLCALAVGLACGVGLYALAVFATIFMGIALWVIESFEPKTREALQPEGEGGQGPGGRRRSGRRSNRSCAATASNSSCAPRRTRRSAMTCRCPSNCRRIASPIPSSVSTPKGTCRWSGRK